MVENGCKMGQKFNCSAFNKCWAERSQASGAVMRNVKLSVCALRVQKINNIGEKQFSKINSIDTNKI